MGMQGDKSSLQLPSLWGLASIRCRRYASPMLSKVDNSDLALSTAVYSRLLAELTLHFDWRIVHEQHLGGAMSGSSARWSVFLPRRRDVENPRVRGRARFREDQAKEYS